ncbi:MAG: MOSC N-terminal beta barrel domain-containing protein [Pusillimonas sp.]
MTAINDCQPVAGCQVLNDVDAVVYHQRWVVIDAHGNIMKRDNYPALARIKVALSFGYLVIRAEGMLRLDIPLDVIEDDDSVVREARLGQHVVRVIDEGDLAAAWASNCLGVKARLAKVHPDFPVPVSWW